MHKSALTWLLDFARHILIVSGTAALLYAWGKRAGWVSSILAAIPVYVLMFYLIDFLTLPLFLLTPEQRAISRILNAIEKYDLDRAVEIVEAYEKAPSMMSRASRCVAEMVRHISRADVCVAFLILLLLVFLRYMPALERLNLIDKHSGWKPALSYLICGFCAVALVWRIWAKWQEFEFERARRDVENILRRRGRTTFERLSRLKPKYAPHFLNRLIQTYPNVFRRTTATTKKKPAITLVRQ